MTGSSDKSRDKQSEHPAGDGRASEGQDTFLNNPAAAMAAATAFGFSMATQISRFWLGSLQGAMEVTGQLARQLEDERKASEAKRGSDPQAGAPAAQPAPKAASPETPKEKSSAVSAGKSQAAMPKRTAKPVPAKQAVEPTGKDKTAAPGRSAAAKMRKVFGQADDLKKIEGIGPKLEEVLRSRGIIRFADLAGLDEAAMAALDSELGLDGRSLRDDWKTQASRLVGTPGKSRKGRSGK